MPNTVVPCSIRAYSWIDWVAPPVKLDEAYAAAPCDDGAAGGTDASAAHDDNDLREGHEGCDGADGADRAAANGVADEDDARVPALNRRGRQFAVEGAAYRSSRVSLNNLGRR